jgi:hypothetical protein
MQLTATPPSRTAQWIGVVVSILPCLLLFMSAYMKLSGAPEVAEGMKHFGYPASIVTTLGVVELLSTILYLIPQTAVLGAVLLTGYLGGAVATHARLEEPVWTAVGLGVALWLGLFLRDGRVRLLLPLRR